jgi:hypothetical protein
VEIYKNAYYHKNVWIAIIGDERWTLSRFEQPSKKHIAYVGDRVYLRDLPVEVRKQIRDLTHKYLLKKED